MQIKSLAAALLTVAALSACASRPMSADMPDSERSMPMPAPAAEPMPMPGSMSVHDRVHAALMSGMGSAGSDIEVRADGSKVYLTGHVGSNADRERAHAIAHDMSGVTMVDYSGLKVH